MTCPSQRIILAANPHRCIRIFERVHTIPWRHSWHHHYRVDSGKHSPNALLLTVHFSDSYCYSTAPTSGYQPCHNPIVYLPFTLSSHTAYYRIHEYDLRLPRAWVFSSPPRMRKWNEANGLLQISRRRSNEFSLQQTTPLSATSVHQLWTWTAMKHARWIAD